MEKEYEIIFLKEKKEENRKIRFFYLDETKEDKQEIKSILLKELEKKEVKLLDNNKNVKKIIYIEKKNLDDEDKKRVRLGYELNSSGLGGIPGDTQSPYRLVALLQMIGFGTSSTFMDLGCSSGHILLHLR